VRQQAKQFLKNVHLDGVARAIRRTSQRRLSSIGRILWYFKRRSGRFDNELINRYLAAHEIRKLHIGCGSNVRDGWLNADLFPWSSTILHLDATSSFPIGDEELDYIFSEHMIEHIAYSEGALMLSECYRILRENGKIRISTPDLAFLIDLYKSEKTDLQKEYVQCAADRIIKVPPGYGDTFVINNFVRAWGHKFIYDEKTLRASLEKAGFSEVTRHELNESDDESLRNLENENRMAPGFLRLETFTLEATKLGTTPARSSRQP